MKERETRSKIMKHFVLSKVRIEDAEKNANEKNGLKNYNEITNG
jgi:hypothetical protein